MAQHYRGARWSKSDTLGLGAKELAKMSSKDRMRRARHAPKRAAWEVETGIAEMLERMQTGRFKVFRGQEHWMEEFRYYPPRGRSPSSRSGTT